MRVVYVRAFDSVRLAKTCAQLASWAIFKKIGAFFLMDRLRWRHLLVKLSEIVTCDRHYLHLPWPPWAAQHR